jgi:hypothetical protein
MLSIVNAQLSLLPIAAILSICRVFCRFVDLTIFFLPIFGRFVDLSILSMFFDCIYVLRVAQAIAYVVHGVNETVCGLVWSGLGSGFDRPTHTIVAAVDIFEYKFYSRYACGTTICSIAGVFSSVVLRLTG